MQVEALTPGEAGRYRTIRLRALADSPTAFGSTLAQEEAMTTPQWTARLTGGSVTFVAVEDGADIGLVVGRRHARHPGDAGLYSMWVDPSARSAGVATRLIRAVIDWARERGFAAVRLEVGDHNLAAQRVYQRLGFVPTGAVMALPEPRSHITEHERILILSD